MLLNERKKCEELKEIQQAKITPKIPQCFAILSIPTFLGKQWIEESHWSCTSILYIYLLINLFSGENLNF